MMNLELVKEVLNGNTPIIIESYMELKDNIELDQLNELRKIFEKINSYELQSTNIAYDGIIEDGIKLIPKEKKKLNILDEDKINKIIKKINGIDNIQDGYYMKTFITLLQNVNFIDFEEQVLLNFLFEEINLFDKKIEPVKDSESFMIK